jgi:hypothetical protein
MDQIQNIYGMIMGLIAVGGGLGIGLVGHLSDHRKPGRRGGGGPGFLSECLPLLAGGALINLSKTKPTAFSTQVNGLGQIGNWVSGKEYILLPLVVLLLIKRLIDSRQETITIS